MQAEKEKNLKLSQAGRLGGIARAKKSKDELSSIAKKAVATRKSNNPNAFREMGAMGGKVSRGGGRKKKLKETL